MNPVAIKKNRADFVIDNNDSFDKLKESVMFIHSILISITESWSEIVL